MSIFSYRTITTSSEGVYKEKGSRFLAFAFPVNSESEIKEHLHALRKKYFDARHHCYAWTLGPGKKLFRANDDGEPNHSAGDPILGQIRSKDLTDILIVVVRYFGGVKRGVGGLISAYKTAAEDVLMNAFVVEKEVLVTYRITYDYTATPEVMRLVKEFDVNIMNQEFGEQCLLQLSFALKNEAAFLKKVELLKALGVKVEVTIEPPQ
jgi:uncharacterized YigZ family protein